MQNKGDSKFCPRGADILAGTEEETKRKTENDQQVVISMGRLKGKGYWVMVISSFRNVGRKASSRRTTESEGCEGGRQPCGSQGKAFWAEGTASAKS